MRISEKQVIQMTINTKENWKKENKGKEFLNENPFSVIKKGLFKWGIIYKEIKSVFYYRHFFKVSTDRVCGLMNDAYFYGSVTMKAAFIGLGFTQK